MSTLQHQSVLLLGLGESGLACARWVLGQGASLTVVDTRDEPPGLLQLKTLNPDVQCFTSLDQVSWTFDRVVVSPGLSPSSPLMQVVLASADMHATPVDSELDLFADALQGLKQTHQYAPRVIAITGTNGKTTTTRMVECLARHAGKTVVAAGNISPSALNALQEALCSGLPDVWVLELSSFQLHWTARLMCDAAVVLNVTQDHLDWHASMDEYAHDKFRVYAHSQLSVLNRDDAVVMSAPLPAHTKRMCFGLSAPMQPGEFGLIRDGGLLWLAQASASEALPTKRRAVAQEESVLSMNLLMPAQALPVIGLHNVSNALAALSVCQVLNAPLAKLLHGLRSYQGEPHRVEHVLQVDGVDYVDDSKGTNVGATVAALHGLDREVILIAGGDGKGQDFSPLRAAVGQHCKHVVLIGRDAHHMAAAFEGSGVPCSLAQDLEAAVLLAHAQARAGQCVLLSPACASFDMFKSYAHRAAVFVSAVKELACDRGQPC